MVADARFQIIAAAARRGGHGAVPGAVAGHAPGAAARQAGRLFRRPGKQRKPARRPARKLALQSQQANQVEQLTLENTRLRQLLACASRSHTPAQAAAGAVRRGRPLHPQASSSTRAAHGVVPAHRSSTSLACWGRSRGSTLVSEVTLVTDVTRPFRCSTRAPGRAAWRLATRCTPAGWLELRFMAGNADVHRATCSPPVALTVSTRRACRWPRSSERWSGAPTRPSPASPARRWPR
jgi:rod shape-determining protein MreC